MGGGDSGVQGQRAKQQGILHSTWAFGFPPPISSTPVGAARSRPGRQVGDPYQAQKLLACSNQRDTTYSPFTLTYYLRPRRWAMPGGFGHQRIGTGSVASLSVVTDDKKSLADWRDFSVCVGITYLPGKSPCKYCRRR